MKTFFFSILAVLLLQVSATADNHLYKVFYVKGKVFVNHNSENTLLKKNQLVFSEDVITLEEKSTIVLLDSDNKTLVIEIAGTYTTKNIQKLFQSIDNENITQKYFNYVVSEFLHHHSETTYTGAVSRGDLIEMLNPKDSCIVINDEIKFEWNNQEHDDIWFFIYSDTWERIFECHGKHAALALFIDESDLKIGESYYWMVSENQFPTETDIFNVFTIADEMQKQLIEKDINVIKERFSNSNYSWDMETNLLLLYGCYIKHRLFLEAYHTKKEFMEKFQDSQFFVH